MIKSSIYKQKEESGQKLTFNLVMDENIVRLITVDEGGCTDWCVLDINPDDLKEIIYEELRSHLIEGELEYTYMVLGDNIFSSIYDYN